VSGVRTGIDLVHVPRIAGTVERLGAAFLDRALTPAEQRLCGGDPARVAGRWAAKEAAMKALGLGVDALALTDLEVLADAAGAPRLALHGAAAGAADRAGWRSWSVSIAHDGEYATAVVVALTGS
jgi:holo-[acyl-carrier protein] synthase